MRRLMRRLGEMGKTIIVSSHILPELADVCNKVGIIDSGKMIASNDVATIIKQVSPNVTLLIELMRAEDGSKAEDLLSAQSIVERVARTDSLLRVTLKPEVEDYSGLGMLLASNGLAFRKFAQEEINLESAFMAFTKGAGAKI
jgi:ABC-2 type transport system ATP-binding protein